jgi:hypothetical protein
VIATSYLRVYQPLATFSREEQARWGDTTTPSTTDESAAARRWLLAGALPADPVLAPTEGAFVRKIDGVVFVCPWRTRLRMLAGLLAFRGSVPEEVAEVFVPEDDAHRAASELARLDADHPEVRSHIIHANWHVPLRWFVAFDDDERILTEDKEGLRIRYEATLTVAVARMERALSILESSWIDSAVTETVRELLAWLEGFAEEGLIELDYSSVASGFSHEDLLEDRSAAEVWTCLEAMAAGDVVTAGRVFGDLSDRWTEIRAREVVN